MNATEPVECLQTQHILATAKSTIIVFATVSIMNTTFVPQTIPVEQIRQIIPVEVIVPGTPLMATIERPAEQAANLTAEEMCQWARNHAKGLAASADEDLEDRITAAIIQPIGYSATRVPLTRRRT